MSERPELALREGCSPPRGVPAGEFRLSRINGELVIDHADPSVLISSELLCMIAKGDYRPRIYLDTRHLPERADLTVKPELFIGALLKINAANRNLVYRIMERIFEIDGYIGGWPD